MSRTSREELRRRARTVLERFSAQIAAVYLFGSHARGQAGPESDVDLGIVFRRRGDTALDHYRLLGELAARMEAVVAPGPVDVVVLEPQGPIFCHRVLAEGFLLYDADRQRRIDFESETFRRYFDFLPTYRIATSGKVAAVRRWLKARS